MSLAFQNAESLKQAIYEELSNLLSDDKNVLNNAEQRMQHLEYTEGYGVYLSELIMNQSCNLPLRQIACIMLTRYVEKHWSNNNDDEADASAKETANSSLVATEQAKRTIRNILPNGLYDTNSKIRLSVAHAISTIAATDWPTVWTDLFDIIVKCLGGNENSIHGAVCVLQEFCYDEHQLKELGPVIIREVYRIFESQNTFSIKTRVLAIRILKPLFQSINQNVLNKADQKRMVASLLGTFMDKMMYYMAMNTDNSSNYLMRSEIMKLFAMLVYDMPKFVKPYVERFLPVIWQLLTNIADTYVRVIVNAVEPSPFSQEPDGDEDDDHSNFITMIVNIFEMLQYIADDRKYAKTIAPVMTDLIYIVIVYIQMTEEQIEIWNDDPETYVEDENEAAVDLTIRLAGQDVLLGLTVGTYQPFLPLQDALNRHMSVAEAEKAAGNPNWWKIYEACMLAVHVFREPLAESTTHTFDLANYLTFVRSLLGYTASPHLVGRALWTLSSYAQVKWYTPQTLEEIMLATMRSISPEQTLVLRINAVRAIAGFLQGQMKENVEMYALIRPKLPCFFEGIMAMVGESKVTVLLFLVEAITHITKFDSQFTASVQDKIIPLAIAIYVKYHEDQYTQEGIHELIKILLHNPLCVENVRKRFLPVIVQSLSNEKLDTNRQEMALDVLTIIVKFAKAPLSDDLMEIAFPAMMQCVTRADDNPILVAGGECLRAYIHVSAEQVSAYKNGQGLNYVMQLTTTMLSPAHEESTAGEVGRLVITIIMKMGNMLGENIDMLLKAVISKMQLVSSLRVTMSLVVVFAHLFVTQMDAVMNFLTTVPGPSGESAMNYVFQIWLAKQESFYGTYERKVTTMALCKIFEYGITTQDSRLTSIIIMETCATTGDSIQTRSRSNAVKTHTPVLVKIFKILLHEIQHLREVRLDEDETDSENESSDISHGAAGDDKLNDKYISDLYFEDDDEDDGDDDQLTKELMKDPIFQVNMLDNLTKFILDFTMNEHYPMFFGQLKNEEKNILKTLQEEKLQQQQQQQQQQQLVG